MLITDAYRAEQAALHAKGNYGTAALQYGATVAALLRSTGASSLLDYGCGSKRSLLQTLELPADVVYEGYDPAIPDFSGDPCPAELVVCIDVLEHIEPGLLDNVLDNLADLCDPLGLFTIHSGPAVKVLSDGRNAHLTQEGPDWWLPRLRERFEVLELSAIANGFAVLVRSLRSEVQLRRPAPLQLPGQAKAVADPAPKSGSAAGVIEHRGVRMSFQTPNDMTAWRVKTLFDKEPDTIRWLEGMQPGKTLLDVGANVGMYTIFGAMTRQLRVYAFEPESQNYALLNANIAANGLSDQVTAYPLALSDRMQLDRLHLSQFAIGGSCHSFGEKVGFDLKPRGAAFSQGAFSATIDQLVESGSLPVPDYIKLDVDGFEHKVLHGAAKTLQNPKVSEILVELNTHLAEHRAVIDELKELGFDYDLEQAKQALRHAGAFEGVGEFIFRRRPKALAAVDFDRRYSVSTASTPEGRRVAAHVVNRIATAEIVTDPFPYVVVDDVFPSDYYAEMLANFPRPQALVPLGASGRVSRDAYPERHVVLFNDADFERMDARQQTFWRGFAGWMYSELFINQLVCKFQHALEPRIAKILASDPVLKARGDALLVNDRTHYAIGPHTDAPHRLVSLLFYLPADDSLRAFGTSIYRARDPDFVCWGGPHHPFDQFERVHTVDFLPNRLVAFPKTERSFHGVEPIGREGVNRQLLINNVRLLNAVTH